MARNCLDNKTLKRIKFSRRVVDNKPLSSLDFMRYYSALVALKKNKDNDLAKQIVLSVRRKLKLNAVIRYYFEFKDNSDIETYYTFIDNRTKATCAEYVFKRLKEKMQSERISSRTLLTIDGKVGLVHLNGGQVKTRITQDLIDSCFHTKKPNTNDKYLGIEIECYLPHSHKEVAKKMIEAKLHKYVNLKCDGSIELPDGYDSDDTYCHDCDSHDCNCFEREYTSGNYTDLEVNVLVKESEAKTIIPKICKVLQDLDADVNRSCGLHVHLDCRERNPRIVFANLVRFQNYLKTLIASHRHNNHYCYLDDNDSFERSANDHYMGISGKCPYQKYRTIEVRLHESTLDSKRILNWINVLTTIANRQKRARNLDRNDVKQLKQRLRLRKAA
jgi:hypothetical protein